MANTLISGNYNTTKLLNQLKNSKTQYKSLSKAQEKELIEKYRNDRDTLNQLLFMHNIKLVFNMAKKYMSKTNDFDGLVQDGMQGLAEAAKRFDIDKDIKFCTYAFLWIKKYMTMNFYGKQVELDKRSTSLNTPNLGSNVKTNNGNEVTFENYVNEYIDPTEVTIKPIHNVLSAAEQYDICSNLMSKLDQDTSLSATDKAIFVDLFYNREKIRTIAEKYNVTINNVTQVKNLILGKFKNILLNDYNIKSFDDISV